MFTGLYTAMITPFNEDGSLDTEGLITLIERQLLANVDGIVVLGTTGEAPTLSEEEKITVIKVARKAWPKPTLLVGTGSNSTAVAIQNTLTAEKLGADGALVVSPYYNKPTQEGLYSHFCAIVAKTKLPILLYDIVARTGVQLNVETILQLSEIATICGIKESSPYFNHIAEVMGQTKKVCPNFAVLSGDDETTLPILSLGGDGAVSVLSNLLPTQCLEILHFAFANNFFKALELHRELLPFFKAMNLETNPIPIKAAMQLLDLPSGPTRLPLTPLSEKNQYFLKNNILPKLYEKKTAISAT